MKNYHVSVGLHLNEDKTLFSTVIQCGFDSDVLKVVDSTMDVRNIMPKTVHGVICASVSDALASAFNDLLSPKEERK